MNLYMKSESTEKSGKPMISWYKEYKWRDGTYWIERFDSLNATSEQMEELNELIASEENQKATRHLRPKRDMLRIEEMNDELSAGRIDWKDRRLMVDDADDG